MSEIATSEVRQLVKDAIAADARVTDLFNGPRSTELEFTTEGRKVTLVVHVKDAI